MNLHLFNVALLTIPLCRMTSRVYSFQEVYACDILLWSAFSNHFFPTCLPRCISLTLFRQVRRLVAILLCKKLIIVMRRRHDFFVIDSRHAAFQRSNARAALNIMLLRVIHTIRLRRCFDISLMTSDTCRDSIVCCRHCFTLRSKC